MKRVFSPNNSSPLISYSSATIECLERSDIADDSTTLISGSVLGDGKLAWLARGCALEVVNTKNGSRQAAWRFGWSSSQKRALIITAIVAFPMEDGVKLLVGLRDISGSSPGLVCLFDPYISRVVKAVVIPYPVTTLESVTTAGGADAVPCLLSFHLKLYFGIVAVGTEQGHTYLVDMRLDDDTEEFDEWNPSQLELIDPKVENISQYRERARSNGTHLAVELGGQFHVSGKFSYTKPDSSKIKIYPAGNTFVTIVKHIKQASSLVIGYNFGCFQIWNLQTMSMAYSSQVDQYASAVTHFSYQEPENDPRNCSYLWVARGPLDAEDKPETPTTLTLYQLVFGSREILPGYGIVFKDLGGCGRRFEHQLTADAHHLADATSVGSKVISCYTLEKENPGAPEMSKIGDATEEEGVRGRDLTLMICVWEAPSHDPLTSPTCHLGIFDINRWYQSQMLPSIRDAMFGSKDPICPFFAFFSLAEVLDVANPDGIVDVHIGSESMSKFFTNTEPVQEQHYWPASLRFDTCSLMESGIVHSKFFGIQRQILANLSKQGPSSLTDAHDYFNMCWMAGLLPRNFDISKPQEKSFHHEALLSVSLEHGLVTFITSCIQKLGAGNMTHPGCSLRLILDWAWSNIVHIKQQLDQLCVPLFDGGGGTPDDQMLRMLDHMSVQLGHLTVIFQALITQSAPTTQQGVKDLEAKYNVVSILSQYFQILLWLIRHGLLPEHSEETGSSTHRGRCYPGISLGKVYDARRAELQDSGSDLAMGGLMVDRLVSQLGNSWTSPDGSEKYPPTSLHGLCSLYLLEKVPSETKHSIVYYLLLDICGFDSELASYEVADRFAKAFNMPPGLTKMIKGFWFLDHKDFENAVNLLIDPSIDTEIGQWQNSYIINTLLLQEQTKKALYFIKTVQPTMHYAVDIRVHLTVLVANGLVTEAFNFQRQHRDPSRSMELLYHFFNGCQHNGNMNKLMQLPFNNVEEECLVKFLQQETFPAAKELLVMYYLQRGRYVEGIRLNETLKHNLADEQDSAVLERAKVRNAIVDGYIKCLPRIQRKLILSSDKPAVQVPVIYREVPRPRPLSTVVHPVSKGRPVSHATILTTVMEKVAEARSLDEPQTRKVSPFVGTPLTPKSKRFLSDLNRIIFASVKKPELMEGAVEESRKISKAPVTSPSFLDKKRRRHLYTGAEALSLLSTPPVVKNLRQNFLGQKKIVVDVLAQATQA